eukprot:gnl/TRDRNA2_/TRDRNA2_194417_c0_seq1.p1 gnl/TRDRNA2_/TRDRNA2_194417_c0~~gnl/TRDRNA2_/TRDRNA2_194417_c0_seq1.p1  ORF type:complete len:135 (-),score=25.13 gnl/TRDRNA2_/TRDRNA2_194417_c0_seq1:7-411(-)
MTTLCVLLDLLGAVPLVGRPAVRAAAARCSQRFRCAGCGTESEVPLSRVQELGAAAVLRTVPSGRETVCCSSCGSRQGPCLYPGDSCGGDKAVMVRLLHTLFAAMPELLTDEDKTALAAVEDDLMNNVFWVDGD